MGDVNGAAAGETAKVSKRAVRRLEDEALQVFRFADLSDVTV